MKSITVFKLLLGISLFSIGYHELLENSFAQQNSSIQNLVFTDKKSNSAHIDSEELLSQNKPFQLIKNDPIYGAFQLLRFLTISPCRLMSSDQNGWVISDNSDGLPISSNFASLRNIKFLNEQTAIILENKVNTLCPIRPRSSNGPPKI